MAEMVHRVQDLSVGAKAETQLGVVLEFLESVTRTDFDSIYNYKGAFLCNEISPLPTKKCFFIKDFRLQNLLYISFQMKDPLSKELKSSFSVINVGICCYIMYIYNIIFLHPQIEFMSNSMNILLLK